MPDAVHDDVHAFHGVNPELKKHRYVEVLVALSGRIASLLLLATIFINTNVKNQKSN